MTQKAKQSNHGQSKKRLNASLSEQRLAFKVPSNTVKDGADKIPTVQAPA
ncbi:Uncharacterised protein [Legionella beliardensis]|uniref:Uncharacterized protein n=1 Tax=Legionella beliardensis TaxID=91822 RepID=A0A378JNT4_9GAMM|nr:hypothetical protein [Legionella beliardensis]STX55545.1 Uncharacterised protein [Legionella beliardensis]